MIGTWQHVVKVKSQVTTLPALIALISEAFRIRVCAPVYLSSLQKTVYTVLRIFSVLPAATLVRLTHSEQKARYPHSGTSVTRPIRIIESDRECAFVRHA